MSQEEFDGVIVVASQIVDYLSSGLYESPSACLKELINNSYDANATRVDVFVKPDADRIIIADDGEGMDRKDFEKHFRKISESHKRDDSEITKSGRPKIGKIGIGFIAANEICETMQIISTKKGSSKLLDVTIKFDIMRKPLAKRKRDGSDIAKGDYEGTIKEAQVNDHYTQIFLKNIRGEAQKILSGPGTSSYSVGKKSLYGLSSDSVYKKLHSPNLKTWANFDAYSKNSLEISLNIPVRYYDNWISERFHSQVVEFEEATAKLDFSVFMDNTEMRKPVVFVVPEKAIVAKFEYIGKQVSAKGYFYAQQSVIKPEELKGLLIRIRNAAVGSYDTSFMDYSANHGSLLRTWISGEIWADDGLEDAMNIDRRTLRQAHPAYAELQVSVHRFLTKFIQRVRSEIYGERSNERKATQAREMERQIQKQIAKVSPKAKTNIEAWKGASKNEHGKKLLLQKFSIDELYEVVIEVAQNVLTPNQLRNFISTLTERLKQ